MVSIDRLLVEIYSLNQAIPHLPGHVRDKAVATRNCVVESLRELCQAKWQKTRLTLMDSSTTRWENENIRFSNGDGFIATGIIGTDSSHVIVMPQSECYSSTSVEELDMLVKYDGRLEWFALDENHHKFLIIRSITGDIHVITNSYEIRAFPWFLQKVTNW